MASDDDESPRTGASRRAVLTTAGASVAALAGCVSGSSGGDEGGSELTVSVYGGAYGNVFEDTVAAAYEEEFDTTVNVAKAWSERVSKLRSADQSGSNPPYDVIGLSGFNYLTARNEELLAPVRYENVPNVEKVWPFFRNHRTDEFGVPGEGGAVGIVYREGIDHAETWADFKTTDIPAGMNSGYMKPTLIIAALLAEEADGAAELYDESMHESVFGQLQALSDNVEAWYSGGADIWTALNEGSIDHGVFYYASGLAGIDERPDRDYAMTLPDTAPGYFTNFGVPDGAANRDEAERFLNFMLQTEIQREWNHNGYYIPANQEVAGDYAERLQGLYPETNEELASFIIPGDARRLAPYRSDLSDRFTELIAQ